MKNIIAGIILTIIITGCDVNDLKNQNTQIDEQVEEDHELVVTDGTVINNIFSRNCRPIKRLHYKDEKSLDSYFRDIRGVELYLDTRYTDDQSAYNCDPYLGVSTIVDTRTTTHSFDFGGPQSSLIYRPSKKHFPWTNGGNLMMQVDMTSMNYENLDTNIGGNIAFNLFITNERTGKQINYVISLYALNQGWSEEQPNVLHDTSTKTDFISTVIKPGTKYVTMSEHSNLTNEGLGFFRVNISTENLNTALIEAGEQNINLNDWSINIIGIQFELEEDGGDAILSGSFKGLEIYSTTSPM